MLHGSADIFFIFFSKQKRNHTAPLLSVEKPLSLSKNGCLALLALLVLHLCKVSCLCRCIVQRLGSADISVLAYNFWQATKASLLLGRQSPYFPPARMPGVYAKRLYARTHTSGRTKSVQDAPTTNDHN